MSPKKVSKSNPSDPFAARLGKVEALCELLHRQRLGELEYEDADLKIRLWLGSSSAGFGATAATEPAASAQTAASGSNLYVTSPFVGTFYRAPNPEAKPFVEVGDRVTKGQVLCIVEAMKLMNEIESELDGTIAQILIENGKSVEYGEPLFKIRQE